jgi:hypothetical protein
MIGYSAVISGFLKASSLFEGRYCPPLRRQPIAHNKRCGGDRRRSPLRWRFATFFPPIHPDVHQWERNARRRKLKFSRNSGFTGT